MSPENSPSPSSFLHNETSLISAIAVSSKQCHCSDIVVSSWGWGVSDLLGTVTMNVCVVPVVPVPDDG